MENKTVEEKDWTVPDKDDIIHIPDRLDKLFNRLGTQLRFHTISDKNEVLTIAHMTKIADDHASLQCAEMKTENERLKDEIARKDKATSVRDLEWSDKVAEMKKENERLKKLLKAVLPMAEDGYSFSKQNGAHQEFLSDDRELIQTIIEAIKDLPHDTINKP